MEHLERPVTRKGFLAAGAAGATGLMAARMLGGAERAFGATQVRAGGVTLNWLTWSDHYFSNQLQKVKGQIGVGGRVAADHRRLGRLHQGEARWRRVGHLVGGRTLGTEVLQGRADRPVRHQVVPGLEAALSRSP